MYRLDLGSIETTLDVYAGIMMQKIGPEGNNYAYGIDSHKPNARIQDGIMLTIYAMEYFGDPLANPIKMTVE